MKEHVESVLPNFTIGMDSHCEQKCLTNKSEDGMLKQVYYSPCNKRNLSYDEGISKLNEVYGKLKNAVFTRTE
ncbi:Serine hydroxymethyltransferase [Trichinella spiralis]|uniref:Serine hydroxymethyltransferase n=1 Tax=Trichinella spiralis TaxID=6334 RepID=A0ABR3KSI7_TRISP